MPLSLDDPLWSTLEGGYRQPYDASAPLKALRAGDDIWHELWEELHHQGDVGAASYAAVPQLVSICGGAAERGVDFYALIALIEIERHRRHNPPVPGWLADSYHAAWAQLPAIAARDLQGECEPELLNAVLTVLALAKGDLKRGTVLMHMDSSEVDDWLEERLGWSGVYRQA
ncbi:hypothetical protein [Janthinobacterium sp.]|uniref:hypothetical protein n=1 Tax=Janthinobacterium sp. TaxID=1871054 RepID=UPI00289E8722|nr:hypothetical protein [Janthinobacterium sp.]